MSNCLNPTEAWICGTKVCKDGVVAPNIVFKVSEVEEYYRSISADNAMMYEMMDRNKVQINCGKCYACQITKRKDMTVRLSHEMCMHDRGVFVTLTYDDVHLPKTDCAEFDRSAPVVDRGESAWGEPTLLPRDVQLFIKRLRRHLEYKPKRGFAKRDYCPKGIRYFCVGEYGTKSHRPHYHLIIYGWQPSDMALHEIKGDYEICRSAQIEKLWTYGFSTVCRINHGVAKYCARYVTKKYARLNEVQRIEDKWVCPEFTLQSVRNGGIGAPWVDMYARNLLHGTVNVRTGDSRITKYSIPKYYIDRVRRTNVPLYLEIRDQRLSFARSFRRSNVREESPYFKALRACGVEILKQRKEIESETI